MAHETALTGWLFSLWQTSRSLQKHKFRFGLAWPTRPKRNFCFWSQREVRYKLNSHPVGCGDLQPLITKGTAPFTVGRTNYFQTFCKTPLIWKFWESFRNQNHHAFLSTDHSCDQQCLSKLHLKKPEIAVPELRWLMITFSVNVSHKVMPVLAALPDLPGVRPLSWRRADLLTIEVMRHHNVVMSITWDVRTAFHNSS